MASTLRTQVGHRIRALRKSRGWTQEDLGRRCKLDYKYLGAIERGERNFPIETLEKIARGFQLPPYAFFFLEEGAENLSDYYESAKLTDLVENADPRLRRLLVAIFEDVVRYRPDRKE